MIETPYPLGFSMTDRIRHGAGPLVDHLLESCP